MAEGGGRGYTRGRQRPRPPPSYGLLERAPGGGALATLPGRSDRCCERHRLSPHALACQEGHLDVAQWLRTEGAAIDAADNDGDQPLMLACGNGHLHVAQWLHREGAPLDFKNSEGQSPLDVARRAGHWFLTLWLRQQGATLCEARVGLFQGRLNSEPNSFFSE